MTEYQKPSLTSDAVVLCGKANEMKLLLIRRGNQPFQGQMALPGGFTNPGEPVLLTCLRELEEETGLILNAHQAIPLSFRGKPGRDPRGWTVTQPFLFWLEQEVSVKGMDDAELAEWVPLQEIKRLAFDHGAVLCEALGKFWKDMPTADTRLIDVAPYHGPQFDGCDEMTIFGGSFNPWHEGHSACVEQLPADQNLIIVPDTNPFKSGPGNKCFWEHYQALCKKTTADVFPGFCGLEIPNPTVGWVGRTSWGKVNLLMGDDSFEQLPQWIDAAALIKMLNRIYIVPRQGDRERYERAKKHILSLSGKLILQRLGRHAHEDQSSTYLRQKAGKNSI